MTDAEIVAELFAESDMLPPALTTAEIEASAREIESASSRDRFIVGACTSILDYALGRALQAHVLNVPANFARRIDLAEKCGLVSSKQALELHRIRYIRNAFAHLPNAICLTSGILEAYTKRLYDHPVSDMAGYFAPAFPAHRQFYTVCEEFRRHFEARTAEA